MHSACWLKVMSIVVVTGNANNGIFRRNAQKGPCLALQNVFKNKRRSNDVLPTECCKRAKVDQTMMRAQVNIFHTPHFFLEKKMASLHPWNGVTQSEISLIYAWNEGHLIFLIIYKEDDEIKSQILNLKIVIEWLTLKSFAYCSICWRCLVEHCTSVKMHIFTRNLISR